MADGDETKDYELSATIVINAERLHERYCKWMVMDGGQPVDLETFLNVLILDGMEIWKGRLDVYDAINNTRMAEIRGKQKVTDHPASGGG